MALVYALASKQDPTHIRYVGKTVDSSPDNRLYCHLNEVSNGVDTYKCNWIRKVLASSGEIVVTTVESGLTEAESFSREKHYIAHYRSLGHRLTNQTDGGEGPSGYKHTEEALSLMSAAKKGKPRKKHTAETRAKMSLAHSGKVLSPEHCVKISLSNTGRKHTAETLAQMSKTQTNRYNNPEERNKLSLAQKKRYSNPEERAKTSAAVKGRTKARKP